MVKYTKKQFIEDVKKEARALRKHATKEELANLDFESFNPIDEHRCVYGQMTGDCSSNRAHALIAKCCIRLVDNLVFARNGRKLGKSINGKVESTNQLDATRKQGFMRYLSQLEAYIQMAGAKNKNLIAYLKGERNDLVL
jgi:hypothetical protein